MGRHESISQRFMSSLRNYPLTAIVFHGFTPMATTCRHFVAGKLSARKTGRRPFYTPQVFVDKIRTIALEVRKTRQPRTTEPYGRAVWLRRSPSLLAQGGSPEKQFLPNETPRRGRRKPLGFFGKIRQHEYPIRGKNVCASRFSGLPP